MKQLLLFDIDGTLVDTGGAGLAALLGGMREAFPLQASGSLPPLDLRGATDAGVIRTLFAACGIEDLAENRSRFVEVYLQKLILGLQDHEDQFRPRALPGAGALLSILAQNPEQYSLGLLTGNLEAGAFAKLRHFNLHGYFQFGAFGLDREQRIELGPIALARARVATGRDFRASDTVIIGDTPKDVECARAFGARCIAVTTGGFSSQEMEPHAPDALIPDLSSPDELLRILGGWIER